MINLDQLNDLINRGIAGIALMFIVLILLVHVFQKDIEKIRRSK